jgi:hypothetical protein
MAPGRGRKEPSARLAELLVQVSPLADAVAEGAQVHSGSPHALDVAHFTVGVLFQLTGGIEGTRQFGLQDTLRLEFAGRPPC